jgi:AraC-like DNA-binding protein
MARLGLLEDWLDRLQALLVCQQQRYPDLPALAAQLHMSERTLKRKLAERGLSFSSMLEAVMKRDAIELLNDPAISIQDVAMRLGYQDRANFTRAFRRWTGQTPSDYRQQHSGYMA